MHEFFHAYVDQVVTKGHDSETADILKRGVAWLEQQSIETSISRVQSSSPSGEFFLHAADGNTEAAEAIKIDFFEEFAGQIINNLAFQHQRIKKRLSKGQIDEEEAANLWAMVIAGVENGFFRGYSYPELEAAMVMGHPPKFLIDYLVELLGLGYESECDQRARLLGLAKGQGDPDAQFLLGFKYLVGDGDCFPADSGEAAKWFQMGAEQGNNGAQDMLGKLYTQGNGVARDYVQAYKWFQIAGASVSQDGVGLKMTPAQIDEATRLAQEWQPKLWEALADDLDIAP